MTQHTTPNSSYSILSYPFPPCPLFFPFPFFSILSYPPTCSTCSTCSPTCSSWTFSPNCGVAPLSLSPRCFSFFCSFLSCLEPAYYPLKRDCLFACWDCARGETKADPGCVRPFWGREASCPALLVYMCVLVFYSHGKHWCIVFDWAHFRAGRAFLPVDITAITDYPHFTSYQTLHTFPPWKCTLYFYKRTLYFSTACTPQTTHEQKYILLCAAVVVAELCWLHHMTFSASYVYLSWFLCWLCYTTSFCPHKCCSASSSGMWGSNQVQEVANCA